ncbi:polysaccharide deacetylase [Pseudomonas savastanoi]|jgi:peptidoglycan/xylan/chitin deacetylase (PgdA/CDA1 family)|uniref:Polysaccharide deacetylase n=1 Tax=Pseudomonas savastanoi TaxID=29438 RepID=A0AAW5JEJ7_PSESS|nr:MULTISPECIES: polysaccharide deacetylase [Pseudomonas]MBP1143168.1 peptidoglycan/xylan/chitin deacetylase (PgdA/CDA1 family) [Pseudomonas sp. PvP027]MCQ3024245.1 polysaccharide deacetylase [Pseudomonas savastanoi]
MTTVCLTFDFDGVAIWLSTFKQVSPTPLSRGEFGAEVGMPRLLDVLKRRGVPATFFVPAHTAASYPDLVKRIITEGHEVACHGYIHESPVGLELAEERALLSKSMDTLQAVTGVRPIGYRSPAWDLSANTIDLLEEHGLIYDSSLMSNDFNVFYARKNDVLTEEQFTHGPESAVLEFPVAWELDDYPYFQFNVRPLNTGLRLPSDVFKAWSSEFDYAHSVSGIFTLTCHPEIIGRGPRITMLEQLISYMQQPNVEFSTMGAAAQKLNTKVLKQEQDNV